MVKAPRPHSSKQSLQLSAMSQAMTMLQEQMDALTRNQKAKETRHKKAKEHHRLTTSRDLIPRPKGRPGRSDGKGYSIIRAMGLSKQKEYFNYLKRAIRKLATRKLDTAQTLMRQKDKLLVEKVIFQAQLEYKIFQKYENAWPVRDLLAQYLRNSSQQEKKAGVKFQHKNAKNKTSVTDDESSHSDFSVNVDGSDLNSSHSEMGTANEESDSSLRGRSEDVQVDSEGETDENHQPLKSKPRKTVARSSGKNNSRHRNRYKDKSKDMQVDSMDEIDENPRPSKSKPAKTMARSSDKHTQLQKRRKDKSKDVQGDSEGETDENHQPLKSKPMKTVTCSSGKNNSRHQKRHKDKYKDRPVDSMDESDEDDPRPVKSKPTKTVAANNDNPTNEESDPPPGNVLSGKICPGMDCEDMIPDVDSLSGQLKTALSTYADLVKANKPSVRLAMDICVQIKREQRRLEAVKVADEMNWPVLRVNFQQIPSRVLKLYNELHHIVFDNEARNDLFIWNSFKADLETDGYTLAQFARLRHVPISSAVWRNSRTGYYGSKGTTIIMHTLVQLFPPTTSTDAIRPLSLWQYLSYFVVPHIACQLIAEDFGISMTMNAYNLMVQSSDVGELINPEHDDDDELDLIKHRTVLALKQRTLHGPTIHDAAKALVSLQYSKATNALDAGADQSNPRTRPKPRIILHPPKQIVEPGSSSHEEANEGQASVLTSTGDRSAPRASPHASSKKLRGRRNKKAPVGAEVAEQDLGPVSTGQHTQRNARPKRRLV